MSKLFYGLDKWKVRKLAFEFAKLKKKKVPNSWHARKIAGEDWLKGFRKRMSSLSLRTPESTSLARAMAFNRFNVNSFFDNLKSAIDNFHPPATRIWNLDETGINTVPKSRQILCKTGTRQVGQIRSGERGVNVTMCSCVSAAGMALPPAFIFPRVRFTSQMLRGAPAGSLGLANSSGWMKQEIFPEVLSHFIENMPVSKDQPGILIMDNCKSHITLAAIDLAREHDLTLLTLPPHCSHKMQPLDVGVFGPFKRFYSSFCDEWHLTNPGESLSIYYVAELAKKAFAKSFTLENITSSFRKTGISPLNSEIFTEDDFLPSTVTDQVQNVYPDEATDDSNEAASAPSLSTQPLISSTPDCNTEANPDTSIIESINPLPKTKPRKILRRKKVFSAILTCTPVKKRLFPQQVSDSETSTDEEISFADSESDVSLSDDDSSPVYVNELLMPKYGDFVVAKVHTAAGRSKKFVGKLVSGQDENDDFEISFLERSKKIKNGFVFPEEEDLASIGKQDIEKILPSPYAAAQTIVYILAQTKRLCGVLKFSVDLSFV